MKSVFAIRRDERWQAAVLLVFILFFEYLIIAKFWVLFADYDHRAWLNFMRNYRMSGFDPITYSVLTDWHQGYDALRHPLLAFLMYPLYGFNQLLWWVTGSNCCQLIMGVVLTFCGLYSCLFLQRILRNVVGVSASAAFSLTCMFLLSAYIIVAMIVPDHFCISLFLLMLTLSKSAGKLKQGQRFSLRESVFLFMVTAGVTLSNGALVLLILLFTNGRAFFSRRYFPGAVLAPAFVMGLLSFGMGRLTMPHKSDKGLVKNEMKWTDTKLNRTDVLRENFFGESMQFHRKHLLGDVLSGRPAIEPYGSKLHYVAEAVVLLLLAGGIWAGRRRRLMWLAVTIMAFNVLLHVGIGFAANECYIMAAHWLFTIPLLISFLLIALRRPLSSLVLVLVVALDVWLLCWNAPLLYRYLTWPLKIM